MTRKVLTVVHQENSTWGKVGEILLARGFELDRRCPCLGDELPPVVDDYAACVVFGGPQSANDDHDPGIRRELNWIEGVALIGDRPILGICLGAQQIARVLGGVVGAHPEGRVEIGYTEVRPTTTAGSFLTGPTIFYQWHAETFSIPQSAVHLAENEHFPGQAFSYRNNVYAVEFHPEMTREMVDDWSGSDEGSPKLTLPGAQGREQQMTGYERFADGSDAWLRRFLGELFLPETPDPVSGATD